MVKNIKLNLKFVICYALVYFLYECDNFYD